MKVLKLEVVAGPDAKLKVRRVVLFTGNEFSDTDEHQIGYRCSLQFVDEPNFGRSLWRSDVSFVVFIFNINLYTHYSLQLY